MDPSGAGKMGHMSELDQVADPSEVTSMAHDSAGGRPALPEAFTATRLIVAIPERPSDEQARSRVTVALEILAQKGLTTIALHHTNLAWLDDLRELYGERLRFGVHGPITLEQLEPTLTRAPEFVLANGPDQALVEAGAVAGVTVLPSALTPNELLELHHRGGAGVQVFPADVMGGAYGSSLRWVCPEFVLVPRGGLGAWACTRWFEAGAACCVIDEALIGDALDEGGNLGQLRERAVSYLETVPS